MPPRQPLDLTDQQRQEFRATVNRHAKPYMRERAGALLKIADGAAAHAVRGKVCCGHTKRIRSTLGWPAIAPRVWRAC